MDKHLIAISKFLSKYLRHEPEAMGLVLEPGGWVSVEDLLCGASKIGFPITAEELRQVVAENDKQRFSFDETGSRIRANQGHDCYNPAVWRDLNHYIFWFHDSTFECIAKSFKVEIYRESMKSLLGRVVERLVS